MPLDLPTLLALAPACAPSVAPLTLVAVARVESGLDPYAIGVNGPRPVRLAAAGRAEAVGQARALIAAGRNIDLGLGQINVRNLPSLGLDLESAFDPCRNLAASAQVLQAGYARAAPSAGQEQAGLRTALSYYNTGRPDLGLRNGYVAKVVRAAATFVPAIAPPTGPTPTPPSPSPRPPWAVFGGAPRASASAPFVTSFPPGAPHDPQ